LQGWSTDGKEASILSSSPRSFEAKNVTPPKSLGNSGNTLEVPKKTITIAPVTTSTAKQPELKLDPKLQKTLTKEERKAQYEVTRYQ
jgi:hypothetical protein